MIDTAPRSSSELVGWSKLGAAVASRAVLPNVHAMHRAITDGTFRWLGPPARPIRRFHDRVVDGVYATIAAGIDQAGALGGRLAEHLGATDGEPTGAALKARSIANGVVAEHLLASSPEFDLELTLRHGGAALAIDRPALERAYPSATDTLVVFIHGLVDSEEAWTPRAPEDAGPATLVAGIGATPLLVRYGTGRAIARNGRDLAVLLETTVDVWPVPVRRIVLVGHSMGGLVARAAAIVGHLDGHRWSSQLTDIVTLGTPHLGSWLEKAANVGGWVVRRSSNRAAPVAALLEQRSRGIKDLRHGSATAHGTDQASQDGLLTGLLPDEPWLDGVRHHLVVGRLHRSERHLLNLAFGDALVRSGSARGRGRWRRIGDGGPVRVVEIAAAHTTMMHHPEVRALLRDVLEVGA